VDHVARLPSLIRDPETYALIGAAMEVHRFLGPGFLESVYREAFRVELSLRGIGYSCEVEFPVCYKDRRLDTKFRADFLCSDAIIVELKAILTLSGIDERQLINYLKAGRVGRGLLINFGGPSLQFRRYVLSESLGS
jgi:GxxExxY protein